MEGGSEGKGGISPKGEGKEEENGTRRRRLRVEGEGEVEEGRGEGWTYEGVPKTSFLEGLGLYPDACDTHDLLFFDHLSYHSFG
jgi:hypothetical protein